MRACDLTIEEYYKQWEDSRLDRFSLQLFQIEEDTSADGPYWVYLVSTSDTDQGFPLIVRVEDGNLKVDWEIYSEFFDQHYVRFQEGALASPQTFRVVIERKSDYYGTDRDKFENLGDYFVYEINPPYGDLNEFAEYAFLKKTPKSQSVSITMSDLVTILSRSSLRSIRSRSRMGRSTSSSPIM